MTIRNVEVKLDQTINYNERPNVTKSLVILNFKIPGGKATYEIPITKEQYDSITIASNLVEGK